MAFESRPTLKRSFVIGVARIPRQALAHVRSKSSNVIHERDDRTKKIIVAPLNERSRIHDENRRISFLSSAHCMHDPGCRFGMRIDYGNCSVAHTMDRSTRPAG